MPRHAEASEIDPVFPWADWKEELLNSPTKALVFGPDDFGSMLLVNFRQQVTRNLGLKVRTRVRGDELVVALDA